MSDDVVGELRLSRGALLFVPDGAPEVLLRVEAPGFAPPPGMKAARARLVLEQQADLVGPAPSSAKKRLSPTHGVPEELVGDVVGVGDGRLVVDVGPFRVVIVAPDEGYARVAVALSPPLVARGVALL